MAEFSNIALSVVTTLTLQSVYLAALKFPRTLLSEASAVSNATRLFGASLTEGTFALEVSGLALNLCSEAKERLLAGMSSDEKDKMKRDLRLIQAKLVGLDAVREPEVTYIRVVGALAKRTINLIDVDLNDDEFAEEIQSIAWTGKYALRTLTYRVNEGRLRLADVLEVSTLSLRSALSEFYAASIIAYIGSTGIAVSVLHIMTRQNLLKVSTAGILFFVMLCLFSFALGVAKNIGENAGIVLKTSEEQVAHTRNNLVPLAEEDV